MNAWINAHRLAAMMVLKKLLATPLANLIMIIVIGVTLSLPAGLYLLIDNLKDAAGGITVEPQITLFLSADTSSNETKELEQKLKQHAGIEEVRFLARDTAWQTLQEKSGLKDVLGDLPKNPLPDAFAVRAKSTDPAVAEALQQELSQWQHVEHAQLDAAWVKRLDTLLQLGHKAVAILGCLLGFALFAIIGNTIRLQILTQREEIEVSKLIGATDRFIRRPFLYAGTLQGLAGALTAWLILFMTTAIFNASIEDLARQYASDFHLAMLDMQASAVLAVCGIVIGWGGAYLAVRQHLSRADLK